MLLLKLSDEQAGMFDEAPEAGMGVHFARVEDELGCILSGCVVMLSDARRREGKEQSDALANRLWFGDDVRKFSREHLREGLGEMDEADVEEEETLIDRLVDSPRRLSYVSPI